MKKHRTRGIPVSDALAVGLIGSVVLVAVGGIASATTDKALVTAGPNGGWPTTVASCLEDDLGYTVTSDFIVSKEALNEDPGYLTNHQGVWYHGGHAVVDDDQNPTEFRGIKVYKEGGGTYYDYKPADVPAECRFKFVFLNCCYTDWEPGRSGFISKTDANAYLGWTIAVYPTPADAWAGYFFDGCDEGAPISAAREHADDYIRVKYSKYHMSGKSEIRGPEGGSLVIDLTLPEE